eukprot:s1761_g3.t1
MMFDDETGPRVITTSGEAQKKAMVAMICCMLMLGTASATDVEAQPIRTIQLDWDAAGVIMALLMVWGALVVWEFLKKVLEGSFKETLRPAFQQILEGVDCCHRSGFIHRDLKPQNILVDVKTGTLKVSDFGLARRCLPMDIRNGPFTKLVITLWYRPPELILFDRQQCRYGYTVDMWSLGCILAEMATATPLFPGDSEIDTLYKIFKLKGTPTPETWPGVERLVHFKHSFPRWKDTEFQPVLSRVHARADGLRGMLDDMLRYMPEQRSSAYTLLSHERSLQCYIYCSLPTTLSWQARAEAVDPPKCHPGCVPRRSGRGACP